MLLTYYSMFVVLLGPYQFEDEVEFSCEVVEVKPTAAVSWMLGDATIEATSEDTEEVEVVF